MVLNGVTGKTEVEAGADDGGQEPPLTQSSVLDGTGRR